MLQEKIVDNELFEPTVLKQLSGFFRGITRETDDPFTVHLLSGAWMLVDMALEGDGLDTEELFEVVNDIGIEILNPHIAQKAKVKRIFYMLATKLDCACAVV